MQTVVGYAQHTYIAVMAQIIKVTHAQLERRHTRATVPNLSYDVEDGYRDTRQCQISNPC